MRILVVNPGSSSLKLSMLDGDQILGSCNVAAPAGHFDETVLRRFLDDQGTPDVVGHRVVHGGSFYSSAVRVDDTVLSRLAGLSDLAPLHQPTSLRGLHVVGRLLPQVPAVACFDTAFHVGLPVAAATYPLPAEWRARWPLRRFGFHGLSHAYTAGRVADLLGRDVGDLRVITCHLGAGASLCAVRGGRSVDTTMGFTPLDGLVMASRCGSLDPGLVLWLQQHAGMPAAELAATLEHRSGLTGLAGTGDMRELLAAEAAGDTDAALALAVYLHRLRAGIASMAAAMDGADALVFSGGVGERAAPVRAGAVHGLSFLSLRIDPGANERAQPDAPVHADGSLPIWVIEAREDLEMARQIRALLG